MQAVLRGVHDSDLPVFVRQMNDPGAARMAAFTAEDPADRDAPDARRNRIRASSDVVVRTRVLDRPDVRTTYVSVPRF